MKKKYFILSFIFLSIFFCLFGLQKINLPASDIGRHVKNGELTVQFILQGNWTESYKLLHTNFYSYTNPDLPFINHHWGSGVLSYFIFVLTGWNGLSIAYILLMLCALFFSHKLALEKSNFWIALPLTILLIPLMAERIEVRPEAVSYLFIMLFIYLLARYREDRLKEKYLWLLPLSTLFWANLHIYFIFGFFVLGAFGIETLIRKQWHQCKKLFLIGCVSVLTACLNPYGPYLLYYPFIIFRNYGYLIAENQSIPFLEHLNFTNPNFFFWKLTAVLVILVTITTFFKDRKKFPVAMWLITITFGYLSFSATRNLSLFGFVTLPFLATSFGLLFINLKHTKEQWLLWTWSTIIAISLIIFSLIHSSSRLPWNAHWGIGLLPNNIGSSTFITETGIKGPFFNNYDIGGYFIYALYPEKVFVDNRPESYSNDFFQNEYIPVQENDSLWKQEEQKYNFNAIWFYRLDMTPWAQQFLINKVNDSEWVPVFVDDYTIIFVKNDAQNSEIIKKFALPKSMFGVR